MGSLTLAPLDRPDEALRAPAVTVERALPPLFLRDGAADLGGFGKPMCGTSLLALSGYPDAGESDAELRDRRDREAYLKIRGRLAARRAQQMIASARGDATASATVRIEDLQAALRTMQARPVHPVLEHGRPVARRVAHLKQDLLMQLGQFRGDGKAPRLGDGEEDTFERVSILFDLLAAEPRLQTHLDTLVVPLQLPILRVALSDTNFLLQRRHPARRFLGVLVEYACGWFEENESEAAIAGQLAQLVARAVQQFHDDPALFDVLLAEFVGGSAGGERKALLAERRHVEAAAGREKLDLARREAGTAIATRLAGGAPTPLVRALLLEAWVPVLALTLLREGRESPACVSSLAVADRLIGAFGRATTAARIDATEEEFLRRTLSGGLARVGYFAGDIQLILERVFSDDPGSHDDDGPASLVLPLKSPFAVSGGDGDDTAGAGDADPPAGPSTAARISTLTAMVRALPVGSWLEVVDDERGRIARRKLAWASEATGRALLVNLRGAKVADTTIRQLARAMAAGHARVLPAEFDTRVDRAIGEALSR